MSDNEKAAAPLDDETITVAREVLFDLLAHCVSASRQLGMIDEHSVDLASLTALSSVDHVGREIAALIGADASQFGSEPLRPIRRSPGVRVVSGALRPVDVAADAIRAMLPSGSSTSIPIAASNPFGWRELPMLPGIAPADEDAFEEEEVTSSVDVDGVITSTPRA